MISNHCIALICHLWGNWCVWGSVCFGLVHRRSLLMKVYCESIHSCSEDEILLTLKRIVFSRISSGSELGECPTKNYKDFLIFFQQKLRITNCCPWNFTSCFYFLESGCGPKWKLGKGFFVKCEPNGWKAKHARLSSQGHSCGVIVTFSKMLQYLSSATSAVWFSKFRGGDKIKRGVSATEEIKMEWERGEINRNISKD